MKQASKNLKVGSISEEFDYGAIETDEIEIHPIQFEPLPGAGRNRNRGAARSMHGYVGPNTTSADVIDESESSDNEDEDINFERIENTDL